MSEASCKTPRFGLLFIGPGRAVFLFLFLLSEKEERKFFAYFLATQKVVHNLGACLSSVAQTNQKSAGPRRTGNWGAHALGLDLFFFFDTLG